MTEALKNFFLGISSTMEICPEDAPRVTDSPEGRLQKVWGRTGTAIKTSIEQFDREQAS